AFARTANACADAFGAIEVGLIAAAFFVSKVVSAFDGDGAAVGIGLALGSAFLLGSGSAHLGALLAQNCLAGELNAIAFQGQNFDQDLIAFLQLILHFLDAMFCDFADVQQAVGA